MDVVCGGWVAVVVLGWLARSVWRASQAVADWKPKPRVEPKPAEPEPVPELTPEEMAAAAKERYAARVRWLEAAGLDEMELEAGKMKAKQAYLRELDGIL